MLNNSNNLQEITISEPSINFRKVLYIVVSHWWLFVLSVLVSVTIAFFVNRYTDPVYVVNAVLIKESVGSSNDVQDVLYGEDFFGNKSKDIINEIALLRSNDLIEKTLKELSLSVSYFNDGRIRNDELYDKSPILVSIDTSNNSIIPFSTLFKCTLLDSSKYVLTIYPENWKTQLINSIKGEEVISLDFVNKPLEFDKVYNYNGFRFSIVKNSDNFLQYPDRVVLFRIDKYESLINRYRNKLDVSPFAEDAAILNLSFEGIHKQKILDYLNRHINNFIQGELYNKNQMASNTVDFINHQILAMSDSLSLIESQLETLKKNNSSLNVKSESGMILQNTRTLEDERNLIMLNNDYLSSLQSYLANDQLDKVFLPSSLGISDAALNRSIEQLVDLRLEIEVMESDKNLSNPLIRIKRQQIEGLKNNIIEIVRGLKEANNLRLNGINSRLQGLNYSIQSIPTAERKLENIERMHQISENMYLFLMQKKAEAGIAKAANSVDYRIIDKTKIAGLNPIKPNPTLNFLVALILGFLVPAAFLFIKEVLNTKIYSKDELSKITKIPIIGTIALEKKAVKKSTVLPDQLDPMVAESFRMIRSNIRYITRDDDHKSKIFMVSSSVSGEGKSFCSINLALLFSNFGKRVLFISMDMRKNENYSALIPKQKLGLSEYLSGMAKLSDVIGKTKFAHLDILSSGGIPPNPTELMISGKMDTLLDEVRKHYDYIILDSPPIGIIADATEIMHKADLNIYVVRANYSHKEHIKEVNELYKAGYYKSNFVLLLNGVESSNLKYNYGNSSYYRGYSLNKNKPKPKAKVTS